MPRLPRLPLLFLASFFAVSLAADEYAQIHVTPRLPTEDTWIVFRYNTVCGAGSPTVTRSGKVITVLYSAGPCSPPIPDVIDILLPERTLDPGQYRVDLVSRQNPPHGNITEASATFTVRAAGTPGFRVRPAVAFHTDRVRIESTNPKFAVCPSKDCTYYLGGQEATNPVYDTDGSVWVTSPALAPGVYALNVVMGGHPPLNLEISAAYYVFNETSAFDATQFERVLLPIYFNGPGGHGSQWITEQIIANPRPWTIPTGHVEQTLSQAWFNRTLEPRSYYTETVFGRANGFGLLLPRADADDVAIAIRVRDTSREAEGFGTEIPAVRERNMAHNTPLTLLNVPLDPRYRAKLRVYAFYPDVQASEATIRIEPRGGSINASTQTLVLHRSCAADCAEVPLYGELDFPAVQNGRIDVHIQGAEEALVWGFVTVTNNTTQQVTTVTPSGNGGATAAPRPN